ANHPGGGSNYSRRAPRFSARCGRARPSRIPAWPVVHSLRVHGFSTDSGSASPRLRPGGHPAAMDLTSIATAHGLVFTSDFLRIGSDTRELARAVARGELVKLRRGAYALATRWEAADDRWRHLLRAEAAR